MIEGVVLLPLAARALVDVEDVADDIRIDPVLALKGLDLHLRGGHDMDPAVTLQDPGLGRCPPSSLSRW